MPLGNDPCELDFILADAGVPVVAGTTRFYGLFEPEELPVVSDEGFQASVHRTQLLVRPGVLPSTIVVDSSITVNGETWYVREKGRTRKDGLQPITIAKEPG